MNPADVRNLEKEGKLGNYFSSINAFTFYKIDLRLTNLEIRIDQLARFVTKRQRKPTKKRKHE
jgi:hypothetical protein